IKCSKRVKNFGAYILAGGGYSLDLSSKRKVDNTGLGVNDQIVKLKRDDFFYEGGAGAEFYLQYFKFAIEAKVSMGTLNMLQKDNTVFANAIDKLKTKVLTISITFEGGI
ncbi:MAG TPA: PorT family protein, partial [Bacteroidia bacterium]|nr:PorT family protein [Bacteroidia bacterium]